MKIILINYADLYYKNIVQTSKLIKITGKFVQIRHNNAEYLIFSPKEFAKYHADIVKRFCRDKGIDGVYNDQLKRFDIHDPSWNILGGGKFEIDQEKGILRLYDNSMAYGRFNAAGLKEKILASKEMTGYSIEIE
jgi:hypothetical protein